MNGTSSMQKQMYPLSSMHKQMYPLSGMHKQMYPACVLTLRFVFSVLDVTMVFTVRYFLVRVCNS